MHLSDSVITGVGVVFAGGIGKEKFWLAQQNGLSCMHKIKTFSTRGLTVKVGAELSEFEPASVLGPRGLRNLDRSTRFLLAASQESINDSHLVINEENTDRIGVCTGVTLPHLQSIFEFDREVFEGGLSSSNPALFPSNVVNAASAHVSIRFNIQGFNTTISNGYVSSLDALGYAIDALNAGKVDAVLTAGVETLTFPVFFGFHQLGYMAGINGEPVSCPFDQRRNGPILGEAAVSLCLETEKTAKARNANILAKINGIDSFFDAAGMGRIDKNGTGLETAIKSAIHNSGLDISQIDYISSCANSSKDLDLIEAKVLNRIFGKRLDHIPVSSIKSMFGETISASGLLQVVSCLGAMNSGIIPPTINYKVKDAECNMDCVPNKARKKTVKTSLVISFGPGGYNSACVLEKYIPN
jgi:3-oxoacyl-[acyl-carrier-protein] synthase II